MCVCGCVDERYDWRRRGKTVSLFKECVPPHHEQTMHQEFIDCAVPFKATQPNDVGRVLYSPFNITKRTALY